VTSPNFIDRLGWERDDPAMPIHFNSRRQFLTQLGAAALFSQAKVFATEVDEDLIAVLNDPHIGALQPDGSPIPAQLSQTFQWLLSLPKRPAAIVINGDLALKDGQRGDYEYFSRLIAPVVEAGVPLHLTMGNHDDRAVFYEVLRNRVPENPPVLSKHLGWIELPQANLFLLDSLKETMVTQGFLGESQIAWLARALDDHSDKPALIFAHHNPRLGGEPVHFPGGLEDSVALWETFGKRKQVKAYLHGHIHHRNFFEHEGIHILNTPATSYVADKNTSTTGWTMVRLRSGGAMVTTRTHLEAHEWNGLEVDLKWRA